MSLRVAHSTTRTLTGDPSAASQPQDDRARIIRVAFAAVMLLAAACGTKEAPGPLEPSGPTGRVRFVNVITDPARNPVNAILENLPFGVNLTYTASTPATLPAPSTANYAAILAGNRSLVVKRTADTTVTLATISFAIAADQDRTVYAIGGTSGATVTSFLTTDDNSAPAAGQMKLRIVNLSPTAGAVDVFVTAPNADLATATPTVANLAYQAASTYVAMPAGTYQVRFVPAGTAPGSRAVAVTINVASLAVAAGAGRTIVAADNSSGGAPLRAFVLTDR
jgi:uncharacterized protein DUF4397